MRRGIRGWLVCFLGALLVAPLTLAQTVEQTMQESQERFAAWVNEVNDFVGDARFDEKDLRSLIDHWDDFSEFGEDREKDEEDDEEIIDFSDIIADEEYRQWASQAGVDPEDWLRKTMRIVTIVMRDQLTTNMKMAEEQLPAQLEMIEGQREQMGEEMYQQMKQGMETSRVMMQKMGDSVERLPEPTAAERELLDKYSGELRALMMDEEDEEEEW